MNEPPAQRRRPRRARQNMRRDAPAPHYGSSDEATVAAVASRWWTQLREAAAATPSAESPVELWGRGVLWILLAYYGWYYVTLDVYRSQTKVSTVDYILSMANLVFHEAGHIIMSVLGDFMATLGGSLFQVLIPAVCLLAFLQRRDAFAASVMLWWIGQNLIDLGPYINDASAQRLTLLGGVTGRDVPGYHDWNSLLGRLDLLAYDQALARTAHLVGALAIGASLLWGGRLLLTLRQHLSPSTTAERSAPGRRAEIQSRPSPTTRRGRSVTRTAQSPEFQSEKNTRPL